MFNDGRINVSKEPSTLNDFADYLIQDAKEFLQEIPLKIFNNTNKKPVPANKDNVYHSWIEPN